MALDLRYLVYGPQPKPVWLRLAYAGVVGCVIWLRLRFDLGLFEVIALAIAATIAVHGACAAIDRK